MSRILALLSEPFSSVSPLPFPLPTSVPHSVSLFADLLTHLTSTPVHPSYAPFLRFAALHAVRTTFIWTGLTRVGRPRGGKRAVSWVGDLFGYLTLVWGGTTLVCLLTSQPPPWLLSPLPWLAYPPIYLGLTLTGIPYQLLSIPSAMTPLINAWEDGFTRGVGISGLPALLAASPYGSAGAVGLASRATWITHALLSGIMVSGGGWLIQLFSLNDLQGGYKLAMPSILGDGLWAVWDTAAGMLTGVVHSILMRTYPSLDWASDNLARVIPTDLLPLDAKGARIFAIDKLARRPLVDPSVARAVCVLLLSSLLFIRALAQSGSLGASKVVKPAIARSGKSKSPAPRRTAVDAVRANNKKAEVASTPEKASVRSSKPGESRSREGTPRKRSTPKSGSSKSP